MNSGNKKKTLRLTGRDLTASDLYNFVFNKNTMITLSAQGISDVKQSYAFLVSHMENKAIYGVNTGFGPMASYIIGAKELKQLQINLVRSHASGMGDPISEQFVLSAMVVRLNMFLRGFSGVSVDLVERYQQMINKRIIPVVPEHGAVGTSGDLVQLAHIALAVIGEGEVFYKGKRQPTKLALAKAKIPQTYELKPKEGLALINGTAMMTGIGAILCELSEKIINVSARNGALALELVHGYDDSIAERLHSLRPHEGQKQIAGVLRELLKGSLLIEKRSALQKTIAINGNIQKIERAVQDVYSMRCIPQILGPVLDTLRNTRKIIEIEMNGVSDNPIVDWKTNKFIHGGNFHGDYIATALDHLKMTLVKLTLLSERRIYYFLTDSLNGIFPPFLNINKPGLSLGLQGLQFVATSTAAQSQTFAYPHSIHTISTNASNQDVVSMGTDAALLASKVVENAFTVLSIELVTLLQAVDTRDEKDELGPASKHLYADARKVFRTVNEDRPLTNEMMKVTEFLKSSNQLDIQYSRSYEN